MSEENTKNETIDQVDEETTLEDFASDLFNSQGNDSQDEEDNSENEQTEETDPEEVESDDEDTDSDDEEETVEEEEDSDNPDEDDDEEDSEEKGDNEEEDENSSKKKPNRFQKRINDLVAEREAEKRRAKELEKRLEALEAKKTDDANNSPKQEEQQEKSPNPDDLTSEGKPKYPLGKYDPDYIKDLAEFTVERKQKQIDAERQEKQRQEQTEKQRVELEENWNAKLEPAKVRYPDFDEKGEALMGIVQNYEAGYAEYLATQIMDMDHGPDVLYYLGENLDEAANIMEKGPAKATLELGYLNGKFRNASQEKAKAKPKVSKAPKPPRTVNKGSNQSMPDVDLDTDDLDSFSGVLFKK